MRKIFIGALFAIQCTFVIAQKEVHILSVNDVHATVDRFPKFAAVADSLRCLYPDLIILSGGDNRTGNPVNDRYPETSRPVTDIMNLIGFNASAVGNHEFDSTIPGFRTQINRSNFHYLCSNVFTHDSLRLHVYPYEFLEVGGVRVGILGVIQVNSLGIPDSHPKNLVGIRFVKPDEVIKDYEWMRSQCDIMLLLSHDGYEEDKVTAGMYPFIDVIIGGHSHTLVKDGELVNGVLVTQAKKELSYATHTTVKVSDGKVVSKSAETIDVANFSKENAAVRTLVDYYNDNEALAKKAVDVEAPFSNKEELGDMMADALREETSADVALQNGGGVRLGSLSDGIMTYKDVFSLDPFGNSAVIYEMTGKEIEDFIMNNYDTDYKQTPYVSGISYVMKVDAKTRTPKSIKVKFLDGRKFRQDATYKFATNSYVSSTSTSVKKDQGTLLDVPCSDLLLNWMVKKKTVNYSGSHRATVIVE
ncbi:MAG: 5'-nucleotidase C-terminal domain-containing protein [Bacteroidaceae bacterium]|nr:5'-nucleotidase C-terminal domain-containing protein [Bacteroidaceae bacterium]